VSPARVAGSAAMMPIAVVATPGSRPRGLEEDTMTASSPPHQVRRERSSGRRRHRRQTDRPRPRPTKSPADTPDSDPAAAVGPAPDRWLTRRWAGRTARLWAPRPAHLPTESGAVYVADAPAATPVEIAEIWRVGPLTADLRALARPVTAPELVLAVPWAGLDPEPPAPPRGRRRRR